MNCRRLLKISTSFILLVVLLSAGVYKSNVNWETIDTIVTRIIPPSFPDNSYNITDFGAIADSLTDCTESIREAVNQCHENGGGKVIVPEGTFLTGPIHLKSKVNLHLEKGAKLLFTKDLGKYLPMVHARFEGNDLMNYSPLIYAESVENIAITGKGILDGNADTTHWWPWKGNTRGGWNSGEPSQKTDRDRLVEMANRNVPYEERIFGDGHYIRVNFIQLINSNNILIEGVTIINSPMWQINPVLCENVTVRGIKATSHGPNNDGCNPESCKNVLIENCYFDTGDDCIAIKSGREEDGRRINVPSENIIVRNCQMKDGHGGVVIGSEISGGCRNVFIENCTMDSPNLDRALRIKSNSRRGGLVENIFVRNVTIGQVKLAVLMVNLYYAEGDVGGYTPVVRNIYLENVTSQNSRYALYIKGYKRSPVSNIYISDCHFNGVRDSNVLSNVENLNFIESYINNQIIKEGLFEFETQETNYYSGYEESNNTNP